jgi:hypothetical protein
VVIPAGRIVEVDTQSAEVRTLTVEGTLRASRTTASRLWLFGNLIVRGNGVIDYGRPNDRVAVSAVLRWTLNESSYAGGHTMVPLDTDVGLWATNNAQVWMHGVYKDAWASMVESASTGATTISVVPTESVGWAVGDTLLLAPPQGAPERRAITAVLGSGRFQLASGVSRSYTVEVVTWTDTWGQNWTEQMRPKVANLSATVRLEAADPNHRPHVIFLNSAKGYAEDIAIVGFAPAPRFIGADPTSDQILGFGRYSWHYHMQGDGSRSSYLRRARMYDGVGNAISIHESNGVALEDIVIANQSRYAVRDSRCNCMIRANSPLLFEAVGRYSLATDGTWVDRALVVGPQTTLGEATTPWAHGVWLWRSSNTAVVGTVSASQLSSGIFWAEGAGSATMPVVLRAESYANSRGFFSWHNFGVTPAVRIVDLLAWRNDAGLQWGAYLTSYWLYGARSINNQVCFNQMAAHFGLTDFLAHGCQVGVRIGTYRHETTQYSVYEDGLVRSVGVNVEHEQTPDVGSTSHVQFDRVRWQSGVGVRFGTSGTPAVGSDVRLRTQQGLTTCLGGCTTNMTLYRLNQSGIPGIRDTNFSAIRVDGDTLGTRPARPRVRLLNADNSVATGTVTLTAESDASEVAFHNGHQFLGRASVSGGRATLTVNLATWPHRRAYFWAQASGSGGVDNASRVVRVSRF